LLLRLLKTKPDPSRGEAGKRRVLEVKMAELLKELICDEFGFIFK
jgi:hypothetical protein